MHLVFSLVLQFHYCICSKNVLVLIGDSTSRMLLIDSMDIFCPAASDWIWLGNHSSESKWGDGYHRTGQGFSCGSANSPFSNVAHFHFFGVSPSQPYFIAFNQYLMSTDFPGLPVVRSFMEPKSQLLCSTRAAAYAIQLFKSNFDVSVNIHVIVKSVLWDIGRIPWIPPPIPTFDVFISQYMHNSSIFFTFVKNKFPDVQIAWQTTFPGNPGSNFTRGDTGFMIPIVPYAIKINDRIRKYCNHPSHSVTLIDEDALTNCSHVICQTRGYLHLGLHEGRAIGCHIVKKLLDISLPVCEKYHNGKN